MGLHRIELPLLYTWSRHYGHEQEYISEQVHARDGQVAADKRDLPVLVSDVSA